MDGYPKYAIVRGTVDGRQHYGVLITLESGGRGFIDADHLADTADGRSNAQWPEPGRSVEAVVLGATKDGRVRQTTRGSDLALARSVSNLAGVFEVWERCCGIGEAASSTAVSFLGSSDADAVLSWALRQSPGSSDVELALRILAASPKETRTRHMERLSRLAANGIRADDIRRILACAGPKPAIGSDQGFYAACLYSLISPPSTL